MKSAVVHKINRPADKPLTAMSSANHPQAPIRLGREATGSNIPRQQRKGSATRTLNFDRNTTNSLPEAAVALESESNNIFDPPPPYPHKKMAKNGSSALSARLLATHCQGISQEDLEQSYAEAARNARVEADALAESRLTKTVVFLCSVFFVAVVSIVVMGMSFYISQRAGQSPLTELIPCHTDA